MKNMVDDDAIIANERCPGKYDNENSGKALREMLAESSEMIMRNSAVEIMSTHEYAKSIYNQKKYKERKLEANKSKSTLSR